MQVTFPIFAPVPSYVTSAVSIEKLMLQVNQEPNIQGKQALYNKIYVVLCETPSDDRERNLLNLLHAFAKNTCYAQTIDGNSEGGFINSARLMEYALCRMCKPLQDFPKFNSLDELIQHFRSNSCFEEWKNQMSTDPDALFAIANQANTSSSMKDALVLLAYSYQNISPFNNTTDENINLHTRLNQFAEKFLDAKEAVEFAYNRYPFLISLKDPLAQEERQNCYINLIEQFKKVLPEQEAKGKEAQIYNMLGKSFLFKENPRAKDYFLKAHAARKVCLENAIGAKVDEEKFLYANLLSHLIVCLSLDKNKEEAALHVKWLSEYKAELYSKGNQHAYIASYDKAIEFFEKTFDL